MYILISKRAIWKMLLKLLIKNHHNYATKSEYRKIDKAVFYIFLQNRINIYLCL